MMIRLLRGLNSRNIDWLQRKGHLVSSSEVKNRHKPRNKMPARRSESQEKPRRLTWVHWLFLASGWLAAGIVGLLELPAKIVSFASNYPAAKETMFNAAFDYQRYVGRFSSDPNSWVDRNLVDDGSHPPDEGDIQLAIEYLGNGAYRGEIYSSYMAKYAFAPWSRVMVDGEIGIAGTFNAVVWDIVDGSRVPYALFRLSPEDKSAGSLRLIPISTNDIFSGEVVLWPTNFEMSSGERGKGVIVP